MPELKRSVFSSEMASLFGLTNKGLLFYEEKGLFAPERSANGKYRMYEPRHVALLYRCRQLRQFGMSVDQAVRVAKEADPGDYADILTSYRAQSEYRIRLLRYELTEIERRQRLVARVCARDFGFTRVVRSAMYWAEVWDTTQEFATTASQARCFQNWSAASVMTALSMLIPRDRLDETSPIQWNLSGFLAEVEQADFLDLSAEPSIRHIPQAECLWGILRFREDNFFATEALRPPLDALADAGLTLTGDIITRNILTACEADGMIRYDEIWLPVENP